MKAEYNISKTIAPDDWRGMRLTLDGREGETPKELMDRVADEVDAWFANRYNIAPPISLNGFSSPLNSDPQPYVIPVEKPIPEEDRINQLIEDINNCPTLEELLTFRTILNAKASKSFPKLQEAYDTMYQKLSQ